MPFFISAVLLVYIWLKHLNIYEFFIVLEIRGLWDVLGERRAIRKYGEIRREGDKYKIDSRGIKIIL